MRVICTHENLKKGLNVASRVSNSSTTLPVLNNILLKTDKGILKISSTNLEIGVNTWVRCKVEEEGGISVPAKTLADLINNLPNEKINLNLEENYLIIESGNYKTKIKGLGVDEFPLIPDITEETSIEIPTKELRIALSQVSFAAAYSETQPEISGVLFSIEEGHLKLVATDRYRLAEKTIKIVGSVKQPKSLIIPNKTVQELQKILSGTDGDTIKMFLTQNQVMFKTEDTEIISRLIDGQYPDYKQIIPQSFLTDIEADTSNLTAAMRTAGIFTHTGNNIYLEFGEPDRLVVNSSSGELGESKVNVPAKVTGAEGKIIFNHKYILDCLGVIGTKAVTFKIINDGSPAIITSKELPDYLCLVMPIKI